MCMTQIVLDATDIGTQTLTALNDVDEQSSQTEQVIMRDQESQFDRLALVETEVQCDSGKVMTVEMGVQVAQTKMEKESQTASGEMGKRDAEIQAFKEVSEVSSQAEYDQAQVECQTKEISLIDSSS